MEKSKNKLSTCLWFDSAAEEAANMYVSIFPNSSIGQISRYGKEGFEHHGKPAGTVMTIAFQLNGHDFLGLNGGPVFQFTPAVSFVVTCEDQQEIDHYWYKLGEGGDPAALQCGWLKDKFGVSWQVVPRQLSTMLAHPDPKKVQSVTNAFFQMKKFDLVKLQKAFEV